MSKPDPFRMAQRHVADVDELETQLAAQRAKIERLQLTDANHTAALAALIEQSTPGEATVCDDMRVPLLGGRRVVVQILGTKKIVAICGVTGADDIAESIANAVRIATDWNARHEAALAATEKTE